MMRKVLLGDVIKINPTTKVTKNQIVKFVSMDKLDPFTKVPNGYEKRKFSSGAKFTNGDTLLARITPCLENGKTAFVDFLDDLEVAAGSTEFVILRNIEGLTDPAYIYYLSISPAFRDYAIKSMVGTSGRQRVQNDVLAKMELSLPPLDQQKKIADILSSLDEKIELNRRMNETLEQLGQTLFRHYFIDNPDAKNWKKRSLGEFFPVKTGKKDANFGTKDGKFPFFTCAQTISRAPSCSFDGSAILVAGNGDFNIKYYTGKFEAYQRTYVLIPHNEELLGFLYFLMKKDLSLITGGSRGSVIKFITKGMIENYRVELPDDNDLAAFAPIFSELLALMSHSNEQIQTLAALRDALLPKLISGEIEI